MKEEAMLPYKLLGEDRLLQSMTTSKYKKWQSDAAINYLRIKPNDDQLERQLNKGYTKKHNPVCKSCNTQKSRSGSCYC